MWRCYANASRPASTNVVSAVEKLQSEFSKLEFEYAHEIVYGFGRHGTDEELKKQEQLYSDAVNLCDEFQCGNLSASGLVSQLDAMHMQTHTVELKMFIKNGEPETRSGNKV